MKHYVNYRPDTGKIMQTFSLPDAIEPFAMTGCEVLEVPSSVRPDDFIVVDGELQPVA